MAMGGNTAGLAMGDMAASDMAIGGIELSMPMWSAELFKAHIFEGKLQ